MATISRELSDHPSYIECVNLITELNTVYLTGTENDLFRLSYVASFSTLPQVIRE